MLLRSERRGRERERASSKNANETTPPDYRIESDVEFLATLTQVELMFYKEVLQVPLGHTFDRSPVALQMPVR